MNRYWNWRVLRVVLGAAICCALTGAVGKAQTSSPYTYTLIADLVNCYNWVNPAINNKGEVAFGGNCGAPLGSGGPIVLRGDGGVPTTIFDTTSTHVPQPGTHLDQRLGGCSLGRQRALSKRRRRIEIHTGNGGATTTVYDVCTDGGFTTVASSVDQ